MRPAILFLDTNILLDFSRLEDYRLPARQLTLVVIPEVMRELRGLARSPARGETGSAMRALTILEPMAQGHGRRDRTVSGNPGLALRLLPGSPVSLVPTDRQLVLRARAEQSRHPEAIVAVVTRDLGVAEIARAERVKSVVLRGRETLGELERRVAEHDSLLDINL